jgi:hypothetical protein
VTGVVQSYGGGVQSRAMLHMSLEGLLPRPDRVVFADTMAEPEDVYRVPREDAEHAERAGIPFDLVTAGDLSDVANLKGIFIPAHALNTRNGNRGMLRRQCTGRFKVDPIKRHLRTLGYKHVTMLLGITTDESIRVKDSRVGWIDNKYPLIDAGLSRDDCARFLNERGLTAAKSACVFCPYRSNYGWAKIRENPRDWKTAVEYDREIRDQRPEGGDLFVHPDRVPLDQAGIPDLSVMTSLFDDGGGFGNECEGHCGV